MLDDALLLRSRWSGCRCVATEQSGLADAPTTPGARRGPGDSSALVLGDRRCRMAKVPAALLFRTGSLCWCRANQGDDCLRRIDRDRADVGTTGVVFPAGCSRRSIVSRRPGRGRYGLFEIPWSIPAGLMVFHLPAGGTPGTRRDVRSGMPLKTDRFVCRNRRPLTRPRSTWDHASMHRSRGEVERGAFCRSPGAPGALIFFGRHASFAGPGLAYC